MIAWIDGPAARAALCAARSWCPATNPFRIARSCSAPSRRGHRTIRGFLEGEDTRATASILGKLGVRFETPAPASASCMAWACMVCAAVPKRSIAGIAGTGMRLLAGLLAGQAFDSTLIGDESLSRRPMRRVTDPLATMGASIDTDDGRPPLRIHGGAKLKGITYHPPVASAQIKSALLLAGLYAEGNTEVIEPHPTRDYTESMLKRSAGPSRIRRGKAKVDGGHTLRARRRGRAGRFFVGGVLHRRRVHRARVGARLKAVGLNPAARPAGGTGAHGGRHRHRERRTSAERAGGRSSSSATRRCMA